MRLGSALLLFAAGCQTQLYGNGGVPDGWRPPDMTPPPPADLAVEDGACVPPENDAGACPCGAQGLCRPATGRLSVQTQAQNGTLRIEVMDDNGCRRVTAAVDTPIGVPRWAPDRERLAYITARQSSTLHVLRIDAAGDVTCRADIPLGLAVRELSWASSDELYLFAPGTLSLYRLGGAIEKQVDLPLVTQFDAVGAGPLVVVEENCGVGCASRIQWRPDPFSGMFNTSFVAPLDKDGPVRLTPAGDRITWEFASGIDGANVDASFPFNFGAPGDRSPAFALDAAAIVYTTDDGQLRYHFLDGQQPEATIPGDWKFVYSPDWSPPPRFCNTTNNCL